jgi:integrase
MADAVWPPMRKKKFTAITEDEHEQIIAKERNQERKLYYQMLWETGGSQSDIAGLSWDQIDLERGISGQRRRRFVCVSAPKEANYASLIGRKVVGKDFGVSSSGLTPDRHSYQILRFSY